MRFTPNLFLPSFSTLPSIASHWLQRALRFNSSSLTRRAWNRPAASLLGRPAKRTRLYYAPPLARMHFRSWHGSPNSISDMATVGQQCKVSEKGVLIRNIFMGTHPLGCGRGLRHVRHCVACGYCTDRLRTLMLPRVPGEVSEAFLD